MERALALARAAAAAGEVPVGAVIVGPDGKALAEAANRTEAEHDPTAHAELLAIRAAARKLGAPRLVDCDLYVTLEPCPMCAGAMVQARLPRLVYGCTDPKAGAVNTLFSLCSDPRLNHQVQITSGILACECAGILKTFFAARR